MPYEGGGRNENGALDELGFYDEEPFADAARYSSPNRASLVIHHHRSPDEAMSHLMALYEFGVDQTMRFIGPKKGIFTLITRPTKPSCADAVLADNIIGQDTWDVARATRRRAHRAICHASSRW